MSFHIIIQTERRTPVVRSHKDYIGRREQRTEIDPEDGEEYTTSVMIDADDPAAWETYTHEDRSRLAQAISQSIPTGNTIQGPIGDMPEYIAGPVQLHTHSAASLPESIDDPQYVGVFEWDGQSPYIIQHKGDYSARTMGYAGWPDMTKEQYDALPAAAPAA